MTNKKIESEIKTRIAQEIAQYGSQIFEEVRGQVIKNGTHSATTSPREHKANQKTLLRQVKHLTESAVYDPEMSVEELWNHMWQKVIYAGTRAGKASNEIESMSGYSAFKNYRIMASGDFEIVTKQWSNLRKKWKEKNTSHSSFWSYVKELRGSRDTMSELPGISSRMLELLTKSNEFEGIQFSSHEHKAQKYVRIAKHLEEHLSNKNAFEHFTGSNYHFQPELFWVIQKKFERLVGFMTSLHIMMDIGFKTVKPDIILTRMLCRLGWLSTLSTGLSNEEIGRKYMSRKVGKEVIEVSLLLSKTIDGSYISPIRQVDIWFAKYGQRPEPLYGLAQTMHDRVPMDKLFALIKTK